MTSGPASGPEPIAIVGIGCRFPGASGPDAFWTLLHGGVDAIREVPKDRFDVERFYEPGTPAPGRVNSRHGGFLEGIDLFDPGFFRISPREAARMDPQQRLLLEVAWEALEDAGQPRDSLASTRTGVFIGMLASDYEALQFRNRFAIDLYASAGTARSVAAGRLSYAFGLQGPSIVVDTACSSSLVAVHLACQSLRGEECELALTGGTNVILGPEHTIAFSQAGMLAPDGRCKFADARADGFVRSDGVGVVVLKTLSKAEADGDSIYAVIRGSAVNNDGQSSGFLMKPGCEGQEAVLRDAYRNAAVQPSRVQYVEAHGTGTAVGDPIELTALGNVLRPGRPEERPCLVGSVKANIGHTEGAAGVAGLIKAALCLDRRAIPASLHFRDPSPSIPWHELPLVVQRERGAWPVGEAPAIAGVSSFGISGTNAHVVLEEAPRARAEMGEASPRDQAHLLTISAHDERALGEMVRASRTAFERGREGDHQQGPSLYDICYTAGLRRTHHDHRLAVVGSSLEELTARLDDWLRGDVPHGVSAGCRQDDHRPLVFVFPGQGSQWLGMGQGLYRDEPVFRQALEHCEAAIRQQEGWSLLSELTADRSASRLDRIHIVQPALFAIQVALAALWRSWGIEPDAVVGHSMGEVAAAHVAGVLGLDDAVRVICRRSALLERVSGRGAMAAVDLSVDDAYAALAVNGLEHQVSVAASNSPASCIVSGDPAALGELMDVLQRQNIFCQLIKVDVASHSAQVDPLSDDLLQALQGLRPQPPCIPIHSTVTGKLATAAEFDAGYWARNLREPVLFSEVVQALIGNGHQAFLELSPHPVLTSAIRQGLSHRSRDGAVLASLRRDEDERAVMLASLGALYVEGRQPAWSRLYRRRGRCVRFPLYPWQRERCWIVEGQADRAATRDARFRAARGGAAGWTLLAGASVDPAVDPAVRIWEADIDTIHLPYLADHRVRGSIVLPAAAHVAMMQSAAKVLVGGGSVLEDIRLLEAIPLTEDRSRTIQLVATRSADRFQLRLFSRPAAAIDPQQPCGWVLHATGSLSPRATGRVPANERVSPAAIRARCPETRSAADHYASARARGLEYGRSFQRIEQVWRRDGEALARLSVADGAAPWIASDEIHPALLDACLQSLIAAFPAGDGCYVPVGIGSVCANAFPGTGSQDRLWAHATLRQSEDEADGAPIGGDVIVLTDEGDVALEAMGVTLKSLTPVRRLGVARRQSDDWVYGITWQSEAQPAPARGLQGRWLIFTDDAVGPAMQTLLRERGDEAVLVSPGRAYRKVAKDRYELNPSHADDFKRLIADVHSHELPPCCGIVHLWSLLADSHDETTAAWLEATQSFVCESVLYLVHALVESRWTEWPRLWLVTSGVHAIELDAVVDAKAASVARAPLWGLGSALAHEHPELRTRRVDLGPGPGDPHEIESLCREMWVDGFEDQVALRGHARYVARLERSAPASETAVDAAFEHARRLALLDGNQPFRLETVSPGILDGLTLRASRRRPPGPGEVEVEVVAVGLNFRDVMSALGVMPGFAGGTGPLGIECAGRVSAVGAGVTHLEPGKEVIALAPPCFQSFAVTSAALVLPKPDALTFEEAAALPVSFLTAGYALDYLGRLAGGERVLIHSAAGGVGHAAIQTAKRAGAEVFATAGSDDKRAYVRSLGVQHVMDSRSTAFVGDVMQITGGRGVDVVLNSLSGEAARASLALLSPYGRFLELAKPGIWQDGHVSLPVAHDNLSVIAVDVFRLLHDRPTLAGQLLRDALRHLESATEPSAPVRVFPITEVERAFRFMSRAKHIGKIVVSMQRSDALCQATAVTAGSSPGDVRGSFSPGNTYLITGGLGGIGLSLAGWLVDRGARHLVLLGRSGPVPGARSSIDRMRAAGARVVITQGDVGRSDDVARVLADIQGVLPPLKGIFHAAGVLDDGILLNQSWERFLSVLRPKVCGAWNLHALTRHLELDVFVLFSSAASVLGSAGQASYSAANAFLDALAHYRRHKGLPALSINWGPWAEVGLAARIDGGTRLALRGVGSIAPAEALDLLARLLQRDQPQAAVIPFDVENWQRFHPSARVSPFFDAIRRRVVPAADDTPTTAVGSGHSPGEEAGLPVRAADVESRVTALAARVLGLSRDRLDVHKSLFRFGLDSLMAVELKCRIQADFGVVLPVVSLLRSPSIAAIAAQVIAQQPARVGAVSEDSISSRARSRVDQLSDEEVDALLNELSADNTVRNARHL